MSSEQAAASAAGYVLGFGEIQGAGAAALAGGKAARLAELSRIESIEVPPWFCVTTKAFGRVLAGTPSIETPLERLLCCDAEDREAIRELAAEIRRLLGGAVVPEEVTAEIERAIAVHGERDSYAVRSSATAEDLPSTSFAGQHDTYLNVVGAAAIVAHVRRCWASLFTDRAVTYRARNGVDHRRAQMAVVVQQMVVSEAAGVLFTANPVTSDRTVASVEASFGLGEALLAGLVNPDVYEVRDGVLLRRSVGSKRIALEAAPGGGTREREVEPGRAAQPALTDRQVLRLVELGRRLEAHFGSPQDIEWCLAGGAFAILQSRPITTLFPVPAAGDRERHVYVSVGHQQMMTDAMRPLGYSVFQLTAGRRMYEAGGRLFVDVAQDLAAPATRERVLEALGRSDPLISDALEAVLGRDGSLPAPEENHAAPSILDATVAPDPGAVGVLIERCRASIAELEREIGAVTGPALFELILADLQELKRLLFDPANHRAIMASMDAAWWLNEQIEECLGERNAADALSKSVPGNVTSEMGLALLDVADAIRPHPWVIAALEQVEGEDFVEGLGAVPGGADARDAIRAYLDSYGMRCAGEIDITRPRWSERPSMLVPAILSNVRNFEPGAAGRRLEQGRKEAAEEERRLLGEIRVLPDGERKGRETKLMIDRLRAFAGYREYPKYHIVSRYFVYKRALLREAERLVAAGVLAQKEDSFYLTLQELQDAAREMRTDGRLIAERRQAFRSHQVLAPPRVLTSDGAAFAGSYRREDLPEGALVGLPVSSGTVEGRARIVLDVAEAELEPGDILVTVHTDPSWAPLFLSVEGLVTEVGGLMTHGAVIAREYGLPAVVGVEHATRLIADGQRIRVHGGAGYVEMLS